MHRYLAMFVIAALAGCADGTIPTGMEPGSATFNRGGEQGMQASQQNRLLAVFNTQLRAQEEKPHTSSSAARGQAQIKIYEDGTIEWLIKVRNPANERFWGGHIHEETNLNGTGPVRVALFMTGMGDEFDNRHIDIRGSTVNTEQARQILSDPSEYYVNLHTRQEPAGAIRGQLR